MSDLESKIDSIFFTKRARMGNTNIPNIEVLAGYHLETLWNNYGNNLTVPAFSTWLYNIYELTEDQAKAIAEKLLQAKAVEILK